MKQNKGHNLRSYTSVLQQFVFSNEIHVNNRKMGEQTKKPTHKQREKQKKKTCTCAIETKQNYFCNI